MNVEEIIDRLTNSEQKELYRRIIKGQETQESNNSSSNNDTLDIAIIGIGGRYPKSNTHYEFWKKIEEETNFVESVPVDRWNHDDYYNIETKGYVPNQTRCKFGSFIKGYDRFDADFFEMGSGEVTFMSPQERIAMETTWSCIEDAGYAPSQICKDTGVFTGIANNEYQKLIQANSYLFTLNAKVAYFFNFQGPTMTIESGCASSISAIDQACKSLRDKSCKTAVVIGANIIQHPDHYVGGSFVLSPTDNPGSRPFGNDDGWIPAEGVVSMLLKPLKEAVNDRDHIYGTIKSTHIIQSGKTAMFMAFDPKKQAELIEGNFRKSGINPSTISYVEAAANGSLFGDAIELEGLTSAFRKFTDKKQFCPIGTVKSCIGHGEAVSTLEQITKVLLQFKTETLYPLLHVKEKNPNLRLEKSPFYLLTEKQEWKCPELLLNGKKYVIPRRASVSSFCMGGNLGHLILEEYNNKELPKTVLDNYFIPVSSKSELQLKSLLEKYIEFFTKYNSINENYSLLDIMFTLCKGRKSFDCKAVFVAKDVSDLLEKFQMYLDDVPHIDVITKSTDEISINNDKVGQLQNDQQWNELGKYWIAGCDIAWNTFFDNKNANRVSLPTYSFESHHFPLPKPKLDLQFTNK